MEISILNIITILILFQLVFVSLFLFTSKSGRRLSNRILGFFFLSTFENILPILLAYTAGHFIYIATVDVIPELIERTGKKESLMQFISIIAGISVIFYIIAFFE